MNVFMEQSLWPSSSSCCEPSVPAPYRATPLLGCGTSAMLGCVASRLAVAKCPLPSPDAQLTLYTPPLPGALGEDEQPSPGVRPPTWLIFMAILLASLLKVDLNCGYQRNTSSSRSLRSWVTSASMLSLERPSRPFCSCFPRHCHIISQHTVAVIF